MPNQAAHLLARGFHRYSLMQYLYPDDRRRATVLPDVWRGVVRYILLYGELWTSLQMTAVACWLPPGHPHMTLVGMLRAGMWALLFKLHRDELKRNLASERYADRLHERCVSGPHWYLLGIAVEPACQGQGIGSSLLRPMLARADRETMPVYLETHNLRNVGLYSRHGFAVVAEGRVPGSSVPVYAMLRNSSPIAPTDGEPSASEDADSPLVLTARSALPESASSDSGSCGPSGRDVAGSPLKGKTYAESSHVARG